MRRSKNGISIWKNTTWTRPERTTSYFLFRCFRFNHAVLPLMVSRKTHLDLLSWNFPLLGAVGAHLLVCGKKDCMYKNAFNCKVALSFIYHIFDDFIFPQSLVNVCNDVEYAKVFLLKRRPCLGQGWVTFRTHLITHFQGGNCSGASSRF